MLLKNTLKVTDKVTIALQALQKNGFIRATNNGEWIVDMKKIEQYLAKGQGTIPFNTNETEKLLETSRKETISVRKAEPMKIHRKNWRFALLFIFFLWPSGFPYFYMGAVGAGVCYWIGLILSLFVLAGGEAVVLGNNGEMQILCF